MLTGYKKLSNGIIKQREIFNQIQEYNTEYVEERYNSYGEKGMQMAFLRLGTLIGNINKIPDSILDVGYGNGDFLKACDNIISNCHGNDISSYPIPANCKFTEDITSQYFDVICFFDALEHFKTVEFIKELKCNYIYISLPWCHYLSDAWFKQWKHRRPDEHIWHFNDKSLVQFFRENGYEKVFISNVEDAIRKPVDNLFNILTGIFKKTKE